MDQTILVTEEMKAGEELVGRFDTVYGELLTQARQLNDPFLDPFHVKLISASNPLSEAVVSVQHQFPSKQPTQFAGKKFGGMNIDAAYIYPSNHAVAQGTS